MGDPEEKLVSNEASRDNNISYNEDIFEKKKRWAKGITVYRLVNGKFQPKELDEEIRK